MKEKGVIFYETPCILWLVEHFLAPIDIRTEFRGMMTSSL